jgi:hypothetical protein
LIPPEFKAWGVCHWLNHKNSPRWLAGKSTVDVPSYKNRHFAEDFPATFDYQRARIRFHPIVSLAIWNSWEARGFSADLQPQEAPRVILQLNMATNIACKIVYGYYNAH